MSPPGSPPFESPLSVCLLFTASQSSRGGLFFDFERKRDLLKNIMPEGCMPDDQWLHSILKANGFDVQRTAEALLEIQGAQQSALPSSLEPPLDFLSGASVLPCIAFSQDQKYSKMRNQIAPMGPKLVFVCPLAIPMQP